MRLHLAFPIAFFALASGLPDLCATNVWRLEFKKFNIQADGISLIGSEHESGIKSMTIKAFGRNIKLSNSQLKHLIGFSANGLEVSFMTTYENYGGDHFNIILHGNGTPPKTPNFIISINRNGIFKFEPDNGALPTPIKSGRGLTIPSTTPPSAARTQPLRGWSGYVGR